jgi:hypothetical protein
MERHKVAHLLKHEKLRVRCSLEEDSRFTGSILRVMQGPCWSFVLSLLKPAKANCATLDISSGCKLSVASILRRTSSLVRRERLPTAVPSLRTLTLGIIHSAGSEYSATSVRLMARQSSPMDGRPSASTGDYTATICCVS